MRREDLQGTLDEMEELLEEDSEEDLRRASAYDNNEVSIRKSLLIFAIVALLMIAIFVLNATKVLPWWGTLASSAAVVVIIFIVYVRMKSKG